MDKTARSKTPLNPKAPFKWVFMDRITSTAPKSLTSDTTFSNYLLIVEAYFKFQNFMVWRKSQEKKLDKRDMFQSTFGKIDEFGW